MDPARTARVVVMVFGEDCAHISGLMLRDSPRALMESALLPLQHVRGLEIGPASIRLEGAGLTGYAITSDILAISGKNNVSMRRGGMARREPAMPR
jgi:hypothetical protein